MNLNLIQENIYILHCFFIKGDYNFSTILVFAYTTIIIINKDASISKQKKLKKFDIAILKNNSEF